MNSYAGIGSRRAPEDILRLCTKIAEHFACPRITLRTGHSIGCDQAFELGAGKAANVFLPWKDFESDVPTMGVVWRMPTLPALQLVEKHHPAPQNLSMAGHRLLARNFQIILGADLDDPVDRVICWTRDEKRGGTAFALRVAREYDITVHNLDDPFVRSAYVSLIYGH